MSKSDSNENGYILMLDGPDVILRKCKRAVTDSDGCVRAAQDKPGVTNLMSIYSAMTGLEFAQIETEFSGKGYGDFKQAVAQSIIEKLTPIQTKYHQILADKAYVDEILRTGAQRATAIAGPILSKVYKKVGF